MKIVFKFFVLINLFVITLFASVSVNAAKTFSKNEAYIFSIQVIGEDIKFPKIERIDGFIVEENATSRTISNINGQISSKITKRYKLYASKTFTIPILKITVDGTIYNTKPIKVIKEDIVKTKSDYFEFNLKATQKELYVGENFKLTLQFKYRKDIQIVNLGLNSPSFENFWHKKIEPNRKYEDGNFIVQELDFFLFPQKSGKLIIEPINIDVSILDISNNAYSFFNKSTKNIRVYSNELIFNIKPLPENVTLIGDFKIYSSLDKTSVNEGESLNYKIEVKAIGNIDDIEDIKLDIDNATIYENKAEIKSDIEENMYKGSYKKSFSILPTNDIIIPAIKIDYFDTHTKSIKTIKTDVYKVSVQQKEKIEPVKLEKSLNEKEKIVVKTQIIKTSLEDKIIFFSLGILFTILSIGLYFYVINKKAKKSLEDLPLIKRIKQSKNKDQLIKELLPFIDLHDEIKDLVFELEKSEKNSFKPLRTKSKEIVEKYKI